MAKKYTLTGKESLHFTLHDKGKLTEVSMHEGTVVELPEENDYVKGLVAQKIIAEPAKEVIVPTTK